MRFSVTYDIVGPAELPLDYRGGFVALIKSVLNNMESKYPQDIDSSPLCFAIRFDRKPTIDGGKILIGNNVRLYISSPSSILGTVLYNGLLSIKEFPIYGTKIANPVASYIKEYAVKKNFVVFATLSPIVIRHHQMRDRYVLPNEEGFLPSFHNSLEEEWSQHHSDNLRDYGEIVINLLKFKKVVMTHYGGLVLGFTGVLRVDASPAALKFFYQAGIGYRRTNGFGFMEVDSQ